MNPSESPWRGEEPPKDGTTIVAVGNLTEDCGDGMFNVEPFCAAIRWDGGEWVTELGLALRIYDAVEITIHQWTLHPGEKVSQAKADSLQEWDAAGEAEAEFVEKVRTMEEPELCQRILSQWRSLGDFLNCLRGLDLPAPFAKRSGIYFPEEIRELVTGLLSAPVDPEKVKLAARQCERMARFFYGDSAPDGTAKAAGYRHAVHIFRTIGGLDIPEVTQLRAATDLPGTVPAADLFSLT